MPVTRQRPRDEADEVIALRLIKTSLEVRGYPPSQREIATACGWASSSNAAVLIHIMQAKGLLKVTPGISRGISLTEAGMIAVTEAV